MTAVGTLVVRATLWPAYGSTTTTVGVLVDGLAPILLVCEAWLQLL